MSPNRGHGRPFWEALWGVDTVEYALTLSRLQVSRTELGKRLLVGPGMLLAVALERSARDRLQRSPDDDDDDDDDDEVSDEAVLLKGSGYEINSLVVCMAGSSYS